MGWLMTLGVAIVAIGSILIVVRTSWAAPVARAMIVSGVAIALTDIAYAQGWTAMWWASGFGVCAALHRWIDVFIGRDSLPVVPKVPVGVRKAAGDKSTASQQKPKA